jgi:hypoxanthine phosphoribosyltransferase
LNLKVLIDEVKLRERVRELAEEITEYFEGEEILVISLLKGAFVFTADLVRLLGLEAQVDFIKLTSYSGSNKGELRLSCPLELELKGRKVLLVDDIFDTGESLEFAYNYLIGKGAGLVKTCVLLDKEVEKRVNLRPDFVGFKVPNCFVVGYGLDLNEKFRDLPYLACVEE